MTLRLITAPAVEPVSIETAKTFLRVDSPADELLLEAMLKAAREKGEELARRAFITQTLEQTFDEWPRDYQWTLYRPPLQSIVLVKYRDYYNVERTWTDYMVDHASEPGHILFRSYPTEQLLEEGAITVRFVAGYGDAATAVPERIKQAILMLAGHWYETRDMGGVPESIKRMFIGERVVWF
jgi:uncharacterized phiE125 gp8 family phage protein